MYGRKKSFMTGRFHRDLLSHVVIKDDGAKPEVEPPHRINAIPAGAPSSLMREALGMPVKRDSIGRGDMGRYWDSQLQRGSLLSDPDQRYIRPTTAETLAKVFSSQLGQDMILDEDDIAPKKNTIKQYHNESHIDKRTLLPEDSHEKQKGKLLMPKPKTKIVFTDEDPIMKGKRRFPGAEVLHFDQGLNVSQKFPANEVYRHAGLDFEFDQGKRHLKPIGMQTQETSSKPAFKSCRPPDNGHILTWPEPQ